MDWEVDSWYTQKELYPLDIYQWFQSLFMCKIATLNFSMGFNITALKSEHLQGTYPSRKLTRG